MKHKITIFAMTILFLFPMLPLSYAYNMNIDQIIWQPDPGLNPGSLSATVAFSGIDSDPNSFLITLTNTSYLSNPTDDPATVLLTGVAFNLPVGYGILSGSVAKTNAVNIDDPSKYWGFDNSLNSGPFLNVTTLSVNTAVSTLEAAVEADGAFLSGGEIDGPRHGILSEPYSPYNYPYFDGYALISVNLNLNVADWDSFFAEIDNKDLVVSFGSPTSPVPEPATLMLFGTGLICLGWFGRRIKL